MKWIVILGIALVTRTGWCQAPITSFSLPNVADGGSISLDGYNVPVVVLFTSNECAFDRYYTNRIKSLVTAYSGKVQVLLINSCLESAESTDQMSLKYKTWEINAPYLADKDQVAMNILGARKSPEAFILQKSNGKFTVVYKGLIDDNPQVETDVKRPFLKQAIDDLLSGQKIAVQESRAVGCSIRRK